MKKILVMAAAMLFSLQGIHAQTDVTEETDSDDIITVTDKDGKQEEIEVPEGMEDNLDSLLHLYNAQTYMMADTTCKYRDVNPVFEKEVYIDRLKRMPTIIEMPYNEVVQKFIDRYSGKLRRSVSFMLGASNFYMPIFEEALEAYNLPLELKYLPVIESALNPKAVSRVGATGLWQFMLPTGKRYGLEVNSLIDERRDPVKASYAAAHYLSDLYKNIRRLESRDCSLQLRSNQYQQGHPSCKRQRRLLEHLSISAKGNTWICTSFHRCQLHHELLLRS